MTAANPANAYWAMDAATALRNVESQPEGLTSAEAAQRLRRDGPNSFGAGERLGLARLIWRQFESPLVLILVFASGVALLLRDWTEATIILAIVFGSTALGFGQEYRASRAAEALRARLALRSRVLRDGVEVETLAADLVVGDVVLLSAGKLVPADGLLLDARDFLVSEASLTGEPFPVEKRPGAVARKAELAERRNCAFAGSSVRSGEARVLICATGAHTQFGRVAERLRAREPGDDLTRLLRAGRQSAARPAVFRVAPVLGGARCRHVA